MEEEERGKEEEEEEEEEIRSVDGEWMRAGI